MKLTELLLTKLNEESVEVAQRVDKALWFGLEEIQPGQSLTNRERLVQEMNDWVAASSMLVQYGIIPGNWQNAEAIAEKKNKVRHFMKYSRDLGICEPSALG